MITGVLRSALFAALAVLLSAGHSVCAGMIADAAPVAEHQPNASLEHDDHAGHAGAHDEHMPASHKPAPCDPDQHDCQHCNAAQFYKASAKAEINASFAATPVEKAVGKFIDAQINHKVVVRIVRFANLWRGPPGATPVSLKIRLLI